MTAAPANGNDSAGQTAIESEINKMSRFIIKRFAAAMTVLAVTFLALSVHAQSRVPTLDDLLTLKSIAGTQISPDGKWVAYTIGYGDFKQDAFITQIWLVNSENGRSFQLTRGDKSSTNPHWCLMDNGWRSSATALKTKTRSF